MYASWWPQRDLRAHIDFTLWGSRYLDIVKIGRVLHDCVCVLLFLSHWAVAWFKIYCTGHFATGSSHKGREEERGRREGGNAEPEIPFSSPIPPLCSPTLSTQAAGGSTAPLQWAGGSGNYSSLFTNQWSSPGAAAVSWDLSRGSDWSVTQQYVDFSFTQTQQQLFYSVLILPSCSECIVQAICFHVWQ